jgi:hypothetical protein
MNSVAVYRSTRSETYQREGRWLGWWYLAAAVKCDLRDEWPRVSRRLCEYMYMSVKAHFVTTDLPETCSRILSILFMRAW